MRRLLVSYNKSNARRIVPQTTSDSYHRDCDPGGVAPDIKCNLNESTSVYAPWSWCGSRTTHALRGARRSSLIGRKASSENGVVVYKFSVCRHGTLTRRSVTDSVYYANFTMPVRVSWPFSRTRELRRVKSVHPGGRSFRIQAHPCVQWG